MYFITIDFPELYTHLKINRKRFDDKTQIISGFTFSFILSFLESVLKEKEKIESWNTSTDRISKTKA